jgi:hypothetical protein
MIRTDLVMQGDGRGPASVPNGENPPMAPPDDPRLRPRTDLETPREPAPFRLADAKKTPMSIRVPGVARDIRVKIASERAEWRDAFELVSSNYQARGYEEPFASKVRFTPFHALPDVVTFVAKLGSQVLATFSIVPDNTLLGLPLESIYGDEIRRLRTSRRRLAEVSSLAADKSLKLREFRQVFVAMIRMMFQHHVSHGGDTWVITVNPRHRDFYTKGMGFVPLGPPRAYSSVQNHPAEGYWVDAELMRQTAARMHDEIFGEWLPGEALAAPKMLSHVVRYLGERSTEDARKTIHEVFDQEEFFASPRRW